MKAQSRAVIYKKLSGAFFIGYTVSDCLMIDHFMSHAPSSFHRGIFYEDDLWRLNDIAELHGCILREEKESIPTTLICPEHLESLRDDIADYILGLSAKKKYGTCKNMADWIISKVREFYNKPGERKNN